MSEAVQLRPFSVVPDHDPDAESDPFSPLEKGSEQPPSSSGDGEGQSPGRKQWNRRERPINVLPTDRIAFPRQIELLRHFAIASGPQNEAVSLSDVSKLANFTPTTISMTTNFYTAVGLLEKVDGGKFRPTEVTRDFERTHQWDPDKAPAKLAPAFRKMWFATELTKHLVAKGNLSVQEATHILADASQAPQSYAPSVRLLIDYLVVVKLVARNGDSLTLVRSEDAVMSHTPQAISQPTQATMPPYQPKPAQEPQGQARPATSRPAIMLNFNGISVEITTEELATWSPSRQAMAYQGAAMLLAAHVGNGE